MRLTAHRRALHRIPELGWELPKTAAYVEGCLRKLNCKVFSPAKHALCAFFDFGKGQTVAFRGDMDALPLQEQTSLPFASLHPGKMHACGHDGHMAILLALAEELDRRCACESNVLLIFQPAEETTGGAKTLCDTGLLEEYGVVSVYGLHLWPGLPKGQVGCTEGAMMARSCELTLHISGKSCHIAQWQQGADALYGAARIIERLYAEVQGKNCVLRFGRLQSGRVRNALSDESLLEGSLRCMDDALFGQLLRQTEVHCAAVEEETGCHVSFTCSDGYPPVQNDGGLLRRAAERFPITQVTPCFQTEDFSFYQQQVPGLFFWLGTGGTALHDPTFDFDERVLEQGLSLFLSLL